MNIKLKIAILMLTKNSGRWLDAVLSPLKKQQSDFDVNLVLVDGFSIDDTIHKAKQYFPNLILIQSKSRNLAELRNFALDEAKTLGVEYMAFIDSDVEVPTDFFSRMIRILNDDKLQAGIVGLRFELEHDPPKGFVAKYYRSRTDIRRKGVYQIDYTTTACSMWKAEVSKGITLDTRFKRAGEDVDFNLQITKQGLKAYVDADDPPAWHIRPATVREELHRVKDHGYSRALNMRLHDNMNPKRYENTIVGSLLAVGGFAGLLSPLWIWFSVFFLGWLILFGRQLLKTKPKWRLDYAFFGWLLTMIYYLRFFQGVVALNLKRY